MCECTLGTSDDTMKYSVNIMVFRPGVYEPIVDMFGSRDNPMIVMLTERDGRLSDATTQDTE